MQWGLARFAAGAGPVSLPPRRLQRRGWLALVVVSALFARDLRAHARPCAAHNMR
jgi:hypothetical protein